MPYTEKPLIYNIPLAQLLYAGDDVSGEVWDSRNWNMQKILEMEDHYVTQINCLRKTG